MSDRTQFVEDIIPLVRKSRDPSMSHSILEIAGILVLHSPVGFEKIKDQLTLSSIIEHMHAQKYQGANADNLKLVNRMIAACQATSMAKKEAFLEELDRFSVRQKLMPQVIKGCKDGSISDRFARELYVLQVNFVMKEQGEVASAELTWNQQHLDWLGSITRLGKVEFLGFPSTSNRQAAFNVYPHAVGLECLHFLAEQHPEIYGDLFGKMDCPFVLAGLSMTKVLLKIFDVVPGSKLDDKCASFLLLYFATANAFFELFCVAMRIMASMWVNMKAGTSEFEEVVQKVEERIRAVLDRPGKVGRLLDIRSFTSDVMPVAVKQSAPAAATPGTVKKVKKASLLARLTGKAPHDFAADLQRLVEAGFMVKTSVVPVVPEELGRGRIVMLKKLGEGAFSDVFLGLYNPPFKNIPEIEVAIKTLKAGSYKEARDDLMKEAIVSVQFEHPNIVRAIGVVTSGSPAMLVLELCSRGELQGILKDAADPRTPMEPLSKSHKRKYCHDIVKGMEYLAGLNIVHRDLAARNVLVDDKDNGKITDFSLARDKEEEEYYIATGFKVPVRWTSPEAMKDRKFSEKSDVWAFGITCIEIWNDGAQPYTQYTNGMVMEKVLAEYKLGCPNAPKPFYNDVISPSLNFLKKDRSVQQCLSFGLCLSLSISLCRTLLSTLC